ncbi:hypothetical protein V8B55DRAFT_1459499 [Mucor lusitanicus]|uniref:Uncharacterized protein n=2 Tax=Mucor circinelloides f. lusitanicus TaxID=29924 RepID=A0A162QVR2_MUCCL|nr:hypothetical protein FB192DRAFT_1352293 [Mucor lusitanicus]OAD02389.1 hypothetical protein MUCCIDRAFT_111769 [Mucor lusitanicus CBS 277.49]
MTLSVTIAIGYLTVPFVIKSSTQALTAEEEEERELGTPQWTFGNTISISCFVQSPPNIYPTLEKHVLQLAPSSHHFEQETVILLSQAFKQNKTPAGKATHGLIIMSSDLLGILSCTDQPTVFTLQIVQFDRALQDPQQQQQQAKSYIAPDANTMPDLEQCAKPVEMMELCQMWPTSQPQLIRLASQVYQMGSLYGYWDYWRVFEGICERHQISANQLVNSK